MYILVDLIGETYFVYVNYCLNLTPEFATSTSAGGALNFRELQDEKAEWTKGYEEK